LKEQNHAQGGQKLSEHAKLVALASDHRWLSSDGKDVDAVCDQQSQVAAVYRPLLRADRGGKHFAHQAVKGTIHERLPRTEEVE
jgi:hypothetical protein